MSVNIAETFELLLDKDNNVAYKALQLLQKESEETNCVYPYMDRLSDMLDSENSYIHTRGLILLASMQEFMGGIEDMVKGLVLTYHSVSDDQKSMFGSGAQGKDVLKRCPKCGMNVGRSMEAVLSDSQIKSLLELIKGKSLFWGRSFKSSIKCSGANCGITPLV